MSARLDRLPEAIDRPSAWVGRELARQSETWQHALGADEIAELEAAARNFLASNEDLAQITRSSFPLVRFADRLRDLRHTLLHGVGFQVITGLPVDDYTQAFAATIFCGIGAHLGTARSQNADGHVLGHVRNLGADAADFDTRIYQTAERQTFHTDSCDVVGLMCLQQARAGGDSLLVSAETIYNRMRAERPDLLALLFANIATDRRGETPEGALPYFTIPVLSWHDGLLTVMYQRQYIESAKRFPEAPRLTPRYREALDCFDRLANDPELNLTMRLGPGDMQFVYNHALLHDRTAFIDWPEAERKRHLLRLWLSIDGDRPLPPVFEQRYGSIEIGNRGGIRTARTQLHAPLDG